MKKITEKEYQQRILSVLLYIQNHLDDALQLEQLAKVACFSRYHFHRIFTAMVGESVKEHIRRLRLERSLNQLKRPQNSITNIAFNAGFETHEAFTRAFRAMFGYSPSEIREQAKDFPIISIVNYDLDHIRRIEKLRATGDIKMKEVTIKKLDAIRVAFIRHIGPYMECGATMESIIKWASSKGVDMANAQYIGIPHDDPCVTPADKLRFDGCISVDETIEAEGEVGVQVIPAGEYASIVHKGPYEEIGNLFHWFYGVWLPKSGREIADRVGFERYMNSPYDTKPEDLITEIYIPLK